MTSLITGVVLLLIVVAMAVRNVQQVRNVEQHEDGVLFRLAGIVGKRGPDPRQIIPFVAVLHPLRIVTRPIQPQGNTTRNNGSVDASAVTYDKVVDPVKPVVAIDNLYAAIEPHRTDVASRPAVQPTPHPPRIDKDCSNDHQPHS